MRDNGYKKEAKKYIKYVHDMCRDQFNNFLERLRNNRSCLFDICYFLLTRHNICEIDLLEIEITCIIYFMRL